MWRSVVRILTARIRRSTPGSSANCTDGRRAARGEKSKVAPEREEGVPSEGAPKGFRRRQRCFVSSVDPLNSSGAPFTKTPFSFSQKWCAQLLGAAFRRCPLYVCDNVHPFDRRTWPRAGPNTYYALGKLNCPWLYFFMIQNLKRSLSLSSWDEAEEVVDLLGYDKSRG